MFMSLFPGHLFSRSFFPCHFFSVSLFSITLVSVALFFGSTFFGGTFFLWHFFRWHFFSMSLFSSGDSFTYKGRLKRGNSYYCITHYATKTFYGTVSYRVFRHAFAYNLSIKINSSKKIHHVNRAYLLNKLHCAMINIV